LKVKKAMGARNSIGGVLPFFPVWDKGGKQSKIFSGKTTTGCDVFFSHHPSHLPDFS